MATTSGTSSSTPTPDATYPGKIYLYVQDPESLLDAGYNELRLYRQKKPGQEFVEITKEVSSDPAKRRIAIQLGVYNYWFLDEDAEVGFKYEVQLWDNTRAEAPGPTPPVNPIPQGIVEPVNASFEKILTIEELQQNYLFGQEGVLSNDQGVPFPDSIYAHYIQAAIATFEMKTDLKVCPTRVPSEKHDYIQEEWRMDQALFLDCYPVIDVESIKLVLPGATAEAPTFTFPESWIHPFKEKGQIHIVPDGLGSIPPPALGLLRGLGTRKFLANVFHVDYFAGFGLGQLPANLKDIIGKEASKGPLNLGGDLIGGAGIASQSISMDGLSTSFNTTSSATNAGFGARLIQYEKELKVSYPEVIRYYKGLRMLVA